VPYLDAVPVLVRETAHETGESAEVGGAEGRGQLNPEGVGTPAKRFDRGQEGAERAVDVGEATLMGDQSGVVCPAHDFTVSRAGVA
jgi:hypothetical protein